MGCLPLPVFVLSGGGHGHRFWLRRESTQAVTGQSRPAADAGVRIWPGPVTGQGAQLRASPNEGKQDENAESDRPGPAKRLVLDRSPGESRPARGQPDAAVLSAGGDPGQAGGAMVPAVSPGATVL